MSLYFNRPHAFAACMALALAPLAVQAAPIHDAPQAYAAVMPVRVSGKQAVVQLPLPDAVYLVARMPALRDLRLFDAGGTAVPFALTDMAEAQHVVTSTSPVAIFPVRSSNPGRAMSDGLEIRTAADGAVVAVAAHAAPPDRGDALAGLVLDLGVGADPVGGLVFTPPAGTGGYSALVELEAGDDLEHWDTVTSGRLSWLSNGQGQTASKDRIEFAPRSFRYARLRWREGEPIEFASAVAERPRRSETRQPWSSILLRPQPPGANADLVYEASVAIPVKALGVVFQGENRVMPAQVGSYVARPPGPPGRDAVDAFAPFESVTFYQYTQNGQRRTSGDIEPPFAHASRWVLRPASAPAEAPQLRLRWKPATMVFVAGGAAPYTLAFGRADAPSTQLSLDMVAPGLAPAELATLERATVGDLVRQQATDDDDRAVGGTSRVAWLWALLLVGVAILAAMVWRLMRQTKEAGGDGADA